MSKLLLPPRQSRGFSLLQWNVETESFCDESGEVMSTYSTSLSVQNSAPKRFAFILRLRPGAAQAYEEAHKAVWPELLALLKSAGISEYSIYRRDDLLILTLRAVDFDASWSQVENHPANLKWQETMAPLFAPSDGLRPGERFPMMEEVFYLP
jgi:L-rhamnose mutarotase